MFDPETGSYIRARLLLIRFASRMLAWRATLAYLHCSWPVLLQNHLFLYMCAASTLGRARVLVMSAYWRNAVRGFEVSIILARMRVRVHVGARQVVDPVHAGERILFKVSLIDT